MAQFKVSVIVEASTAADAVAQIGMAGTVSNVEHLSGALADPRLPTVDGDYTDADGSEWYLDAGTWYYTDFAHHNNALNTKYKPEDMNPNWLPMRPGWHYDD